MRIERESWPAEQIVNWVGGGEYGPERRIGTDGEVSLLMLLIWDG